MANRYWVGNGGSWSDTAHWSTTSGGSGGASIPFIGDTANFDSNSFSTTGQVVTASTFDVTNIVCSATNNPTLRLGSSGHTVFGSMNWTGMTIEDPADMNKKILWQPSIAGTYDLTTGGGSMPNITINPGAVSGVTFRLQDNCTLYSGGMFLVLTFVTTTLTLNSYTLTAPYFYNTVGVTVNFGTGNIVSSNLINLASGTTVSGTGTTFTVSSGGAIILDSTTLSGSSASDRLTITNNSGTTQTISNSTLTNTVLNGSSPFNMVEIIDGGGNDWGDGGGGTGNPTRLYHVKIPPTYVALP